VIQHRPFWATERRSHNAFGFPNYKVDIAIIGGGLKGLATMYFLSALNLRCILLERGTLGCGESTRNIGAVCSVPDCSPNLFDEDVVVQRIRMAEKNRDMLSSMVNELNFDINLVRNGGLHLAANEIQVAQLEVLHGLLVKNNIVCDELDSKQVNDLVAGSKFEAGLYYPGEATLNPNKLLDLFITLNQTFVNNVAVEYFVVNDLYETDTGVEIVSDNGTKIYARTAIVCTDQFKRFYPDTTLSQGEETKSLCFASQPIDKMVGKMPMTSRTVTGMQAWTVHNGRIIYTFRNRTGFSDNFGYNEDDIRKAQRFLTQYIPISKGHYYQEFIWSSVYRKAERLLPFISKAPGSEKIVFNVGYGYSTLDLFFTGAEEASECAKQILNNESPGGAEGVKQTPEGDP